LIANNIRYPLYFFPYADHVWIRLMHNGASSFYRAEACYRVVLPACRAVIQLLCSYSTLPLYAIVTQVRRYISLMPTTGNAASTESSLLCREPDPKLSAQRRFAESEGFSSRHRKNPRYRVPVPRGNSAASRHRRLLTAQRICAESCRSGPSAQTPPHGAT
jgi:hypothetical protein